MCRYLPRGLEVTRGHRFRGCIRYELSTTNSIRPHVFEAKVFFKTRPNLKALPSANAESPAWRCRPRSLASSTPYNSVLFMPLLYPLAPPAHLCAPCLPLWISSKSIYTNRLKRMAPLCLAKRTVNPRPTKWGTLDMHLFIQVYG